MLKKGGNFHRWLLYVPLLLIVLYLMQRWKADNSLKRKDHFRELEERHINDILLRAKVEGLKKQLQSQKQQQQQQQQQQEQNNQKQEREYINPIINKDMPQIWPDLLELDFAKRQKEIPPFGVLYILGSQSPDIPQYKGRFENAGGRMNLYLSELERSISSLRNSNPTGLSVSYFSLLEEAYHIILMNT